MSISLSEIIFNKVKSKLPLMDPLSIRQDLTRKKEEFFAILKNYNVSNSSLAALEYHLEKSVNVRYIDEDLKKILTIVANELIAHKPLPEAIVVLEEGLKSLGVPLKGIDSSPLPIKGEIDLCATFTQAIKFAFEIRRN